MSVFDVDKSSLLREVLLRHGVTITFRQGWQSISCPIKSGHSHGDADKSASANISTGYINCHGCGFKGDGFAIMQELEGMDANEVREVFGLGESRRDASFSSKDSKEAAKYLGEAFTFDR